MQESLWTRTLHRWRSVFLNARLLVILFLFWITGVTVGPWGTFDTMDVGERAIFCANVTLIGWGLGILLNVPLRIWLEDRGVQRPWSILASTTASNLVVIPVLVVYIQWALERSLPFGRTVELFLLIAVLITTLVLAFLAPPSLLRRGSAKDGGRAAAGIVGAALLERIAPSKRAPLLALLAQDHYVEVVTDAGSELLLMRLGDAIALCSPGAGLQVHRSAYVTRAGIAEVERRNRRTRIRLANGRYVPVSRSSEAALRTFLEDADRPASAAGALRRA